MFMNLFFIFFSIGAIFHCSVVQLQARNFFSEPEDERGPFSSTPISAHTAEPPFPLPVTIPYNDMDLAVAGV